MFTASALQRRALHAPAFTVLAVLFAVALCAGPARADDDGEDGGAVRLLTTIPIPGTALRGFDISWVDASTQRYYLADRSNQAVDVIDAPPIGTVTLIAPTGLRIEGVSIDAAIAILRGIA